MIFFGTNDKIQVCLQLQTLKLNANELNILILFQDMYTKMIDISHDQSFIQRICRLGPNKQNYLILLKRKGVLTYLSFQQFRQSILKTTNYLPDFVNKLQDQYIIYLKTTKKAQEDVKFPWVKHKNAEFTKINIQRFMSQYQFPQYSQQVSAQNSIEKSPKIQTLQQFTQEKQSPYVQLTEEQLKYKRQTEEIYKIPPFLFNKTRSLATLTGLDLTLFFKKQINDVTRMIRQQIDGNYLINVFCRYLNKYRKIKYINQYSQSSQKQKIMKFIKEFTPANPNKQQLLDLWDKINQGLKVLLQKRLQKDTIKKILIQGLRSVYIVFNLMDLDSIIYGATCNCAISININHLQPNLDFNQFRQVLRPFFALTLYDQLAHYLIQRTQETEVKQYGASFDSSNQSIGICLLKTAYKYYIEVPPYLKIYQQKQRKFQLKPFTQQLRSFLKNQEKFCEKLVLKIQNISEIIKKIRINKQLSSLMGRKIWNMNWEQSLNQLDKYIDLLQTKTSNDSSDGDILNKRLQYKFFFATFLSLTKVVNEIKTNQAKQKYQQITNKIKLSNIEIFYSQNNQFIETFIDKITQSKEIDFDSTLVHDFIHISLNSTNKSYYIDQLKEIWIELGADNIKNFCEQGQSLLSENQEELQYTFRSFYLTKWNQLDKSCYVSINLSLISKKLQLIIDTVQLYQIFTDYLKYAQIIAICLQMPAFYQQLQTPTNQLNKKLESVYPIQKIMFPKLYESGRIYAKDYTFMQDIEDQRNRLEVGKQPLSYQQMRLSFLVIKGSTKNRDLSLCIDLRHGTCGNFLRKIQIYNQKEQEKKLEDAKMKKNKEKQS